MCKFIGIECVAGNAIITLFEEKALRKVSFTHLVKYGLKVVEQYSKENGETAVLIYDERAIDSMFTSCADIFCVITKDGMKYLGLREEITDISPLKERFRYPMSYKLARAILSEESLQELAGVA